MLKESISPILTLARRHFIMATKTTHAGLGILLLIPQLVILDEFLNFKPNPKELTSVMKLGRGYLT
jgi:hypothetical protein